MTFLYGLAYVVDCLHFYASIQLYTRCGNDNGCVDNYGQYFKSSNQYVPQDPNAKEVN
uniref:Uncharacterized protein n=1 Tax=Anguilla anguilla TaxID=7936 RepID=A0A0E9PMK4_ANGAN